MTTTINSDDFIVTAFVDSSDPNTVLGPSAAVGEGGKVLFSVQKFLADHPTLANITGTVTSVLSISPVGGDVTFDADDISEGSTNLFLTAGERSAIASNSSLINANTSAIARTTGTLPLTFTTALAFDAATKINATCTLTGNTVPSLITNANVGETCTYTLTQDSTGGRYVDWSAFEGEAILAGEAGSITTVSVFIQSDTVQRITSVASDAAPTEKIITYPLNFATIGGGATNVWSNVNNGFWTWEEVNKYQFCGYSDLQYAGWEYSSTLKNRVKQVKANAPRNFKVLAFIRHDLWWFYNENGTADATRQWGNAACIGGAKPTAAMGAVVDNAASWATGQATIESGTYTQNATHATITNSGALLTLPYEIYLDAADNEWSCRNNVMKHNDENWLDLLTDNLAYQFGFGEVDGFYINPQKLQHYQTASSVSIQLHEWLEDVVDPAVPLAGGTSNPGWVLNTDSGGSSGTGQKPSWSVGSTTVQDGYDDYNGALDLVTLFESCELLIRMIRDKIPRAFLVYSPFNYTVPSWRNTVYRNNFRSAAQATYPATITDDVEADAYFAELIARCSSLCDSTEIYMDDDGGSPGDTNAFASPFLANLRRGPHIKRSSSPQDISVLAQQ